MSIFNKVRELFYGRPKKLASNSTRGERGQYGEDLAADYCKRTLGFQVIARNSVSYTHLTLPTTKNV